MVTTGALPPRIAGRRRLSLAAVAFLLATPLLPARAAAQAPLQSSFDGQRIAAIVFDPPDQPYPTPFLLNLLPLKTGAIFHQRDLRAAIQALYSSGRFADIAVDATHAPGGVVLKFLTSRAYFVGRVTVAGIRQPPNQGQLVSATKLQLGAGFGAPDQRRAVESLLLLLRQNGFYHAKVFADTQYIASTEQADVHFQVQSGKRARFEIPVVTGHPGRPVEDVVDSTGWRHLWGLFGWHQVTESRVQHGIESVRNYYQKKDLLLAQVKLRQLEYRPATNTVKPYLDVEAGLPVAIRAVGAHLSRGKLKQLVPIYEERTVDRDLLVEGQRNIQQYLQNQGFFDAEVTFTEDTGQGHGASVTYNILRGRRHKFVALHIAGNRYFDLATIRERMFITPATFPRFPHGRYSNALLEKDREAIIALYRSNGFANAKIATKTVDNYKGKTNDVAVFLTIDEGAQTFVSNVALDGVMPQDQDYLHSILLSAAGQPFSEINVATDRDNILNYYYNNGYVNAAFDYYSDPAGKPDRVNLRFVVTPGPQTFVRRVLVTGIGITRPHLVADRIHLHPGDPLSLAKNTEAERELYDLGIFARVSTALQNPDSSENQKYVLFQLDEAHRYSFNFGLGADMGLLGGGTSLAAPAGAAGFAPRVSLGISRINFAGLGHTVSLQGRVSNIDQRVSLSYLAPQFTGNENLSLTFNTLYDSSHEVRTFSSIRREASAQLGQKISRAVSLQYRLVYRDVTQSNLIISPLLVPLFSEPVRVGVVGASFIQDKRDDPVDSHRGTYTTVDASYASTFLGSKTSFTRLTARNSSYYRIGKQYVLARSTYVGWIQRISGLRQIPLPERFFAGGPTSLRSFPIDQAGPRDLLTGFPLGGDAVFINNTELRFPLFGDTIGGVIFHDAGNVYSDIRNISFRWNQRNLQDFNYMVHAVGFGIRYHTPIGPISLDLAYVPNSPRFYGLKGSYTDFLNPDIHLPSVNQRISRFQFHFSIGQAF